MTWHFSYTSIRGGIYHSYAYLHQPLCIPVYQYRRQLLLDYSHQAVVLSACLKATCGAVVLLEWLCSISCNSEGSNALVCCGWIKHTGSCPLSLFQIHMFSELVCCCCCAVAVLLLCCCWSSLWLWCSISSNTVDNRDICTLWLNYTRERLPSRPRFSEIGFCRRSVMYLAMVFY